MDRPDLRPLCLACGGLVATHDGTNGETGECPACGPVHFSGMPGDIDLMCPSLPRYVPDEPPAVCLACGAIPDTEAPAEGADATCPQCGQVGFAVVDDARGERVQGYLPLTDPRMQQLPEPDPLF